MEFRRLTDDDLPMLHAWLNEPGVVRWWEGEDVSWDAVVADYGSAATDPVEHWLSVLDGEPLGWIQCFAAADFDDDEEARAWFDAGVPRTAAGVDYLVGDPTRRGGGHGSTMIDRFVTEIVFAQHPGWTHVCASPYAANEASCRALARAGFTFRAEILADTGDPDGPCHLYVRDRP